MKNRDDILCPACGGRDYEPVLELPGVPILCNVLIPEAAKALRVPRGEIRLCLCRDCSHLFNDRFMPDLVVYGPDYENSLEFSKVFRMFAGRLARRLIEKYGLRGKKILEIGCGQGEFLELMAVLGGNRCIGFDPAFQDGVERRGLRTVSIFKQGFDPSRGALPAADFVICRHVLEHLADPADFLRGIAKAVDVMKGMAFYMEVPNGEGLFRKQAVWDIIYEHPSHFTRTSLAVIFRRAGLPADISETYHGRYLYARSSAAVQSFAGGGTGKRLSARALCSRIDRIRTCGDNVSRWRNVLEKCRGAGQRTVLWGAGSKGVTFANLVSGNGEIQCVVDVNPRKQGMFLPGVGLPIIPPSSLRRVSPRFVIVMNRIYEREIRKTLEHLGLTPELLFP